MYANMEFKCGRCGYTGKSRWSLLRHLDRKIACHAVRLDVSIEELKKGLAREYNENHHVCKYCDKKFNTTQSMYRHHKTCKQKSKQNPNALEKRIVVLEKQILSMENERKSIPSNDLLQLELQYYKNKKNRKVLPDVVGKLSRWDTYDSIMWNNRCNNRDMSCRNQGVVKMEGSGWSTDMLQYSTSETNACNVYVWKVWQESQDRSCKSSPRM